jgi:hypothetical protein
MPDLRVCARAPDGSVGARDLQLPALRHRRIHIGFLHATSDGLVEVASVATGRPAARCRREHE